MTKHYVLISLTEPPESDNAGRQAWRGLMSGPLHDNKRADIKTGRIGDNVWLLERENAASVLAQIVSEAEAFHIEYSVRYLSEEWAEGHG